MPRSSLFTRSTDLITSLSLSVLAHPYQHAAGKNVNLAKLSTWVEDMAEAVIEASNVYICVGFSEPNQRPPIMTQDAPELHAPMGTRVISNLML